MAFVTLSRLNEETKYPDVFAAVEISTQVTLYSRTEAIWMTIKQAKK